MRAVSLSDATVQKKIKKSFIPLKIAILPGTKDFPVKWPALLSWQITYKVMGGEKCEGITASIVVTPDLKAQYANTGSAFVWELFDSIAYDAKKFAAMLDRGLKRWEQEKEIRADKSLKFGERIGKLLKHRADVRKALGQEGKLKLPPKGFTAEGAIELFKLSGDLPKKKD